MRLSVIFLVLAAGAAAEPQVEGGRVEVVFFEPEKFTDVRDSWGGGHERTTYLDSLREHLVARAKGHVPAGHTLRVVITDIDMAGDFEPWRGPGWHDVRVVKEIYPPRVTLEFRLTKPDGAVVAEGRRVLRDPAFLMKLPTGFRDDPMRHEKALLDDWLAGELPARKR